MGKQFHRNDNSQRPLLKTEPVLSPGPLAAKRRVQKLLDLLLGPDALLHLPAREMDLVTPVRHARFHNGREGCVRLCRRPVGRADGEEARDETRVPECGAVDDGSALLGSIVCDE